MDAFRHYLGLVLTVFMSPLVLYWCLLHPWVGFWRRLGPGKAMTVLWSLVALGVAGLFTQRDWLMAHDLGTHPALFAAGVIFLVVAAVARRQLAVHFSFRTLIGLSELAPDRFPQRLVTEGLHAWVRHPRYLQMLVALLGWSLMANHPAAYAACALWLPGMVLVVLLEEKELHRRFGAEFEDYCRRVPRFIPRWRNH